MSYRNSVIIAAMFVLSSVAGFACGDAEPKEIVPNATANVTPNNTSANNTSANNTSANNVAPECTINGGCPDDQVCMNGECVVACLLDSDCPATEVCESEQCIPTCTTDADCLAGEICSVRQNGQGTICVPDRPNNENPGGCVTEPDPNAFCERELGPNAFCDTVIGECVENMTTSPYTAVQILDVTADFAACDGTNDPGSDLQGVELADANGNTLGWADLVWDDAITVGNDEYNPSLLMAHPPISTPTDASTRLAATCSRSAAAAGSPSISSTRVATESRPKAETTSPSTSTAAYVPPVRRAMNTPSRCAPARRS